MPNSTLGHPRRPGRPRKYASATERVSAFRSIHGLSKVTVDVPREFADQLRDYARELRKMASAPRFDLKRAQYYLSTASSLTPKEVAESYVMRMQWVRVARGTHLLYDRLHWITAEITRSSQNHGEPLTWLWRVEKPTETIYPDHPAAIAQGCSVTLGIAKEITAAVVKSYLENDQVFYENFVNTLSESVKL